LEVEKTVEILTAQRRRAPTPAELGEAIGADVEEVLEALCVTSDATVTSLNAPRETCDGERESRIDLLQSREDGYQLVEHRSAAATALTALPDRERVVLGLRFLHDMTQTEIAVALGISQMQVSRLIRRALATLRAVVDDSD
jgi:RNA polymerase sigma-B factor